MLNCLFCTIYSALNQIKSVNGILTIFGINTKLMLSSRYVLKNSCFQPSLEELICAASEDNRYLNNGILFDYRLELRTYSEALEKLMVKNAFAGNSETACYGALIQKGYQVSIIVNSDVKPELFRPEKRGDVFIGR